MLRIDNKELLEKVRLLAHTLGKNTSLVSGGDTSLTHYSAFKHSATHVHAEYKRLAEEVSRQKHLTHEIESIFDNFFVVESAIFEIKSNLKKEDIRKLPLIKTSKNEQIPRLYYILTRLIEDTNRIVDKEIVNEFLKEYQEYSPLSIRELYAIPIVLQVIFVENFGKLIERALDSLAEYKEAGEIARRIKKVTSKKGQHNFSGIISELAKDYSIVPLSLGFYLFQRLSPEASSMRPVLKWLKLNFEKQGIDVRDLADLENRERGRNSIISSNIIESLHWLTQARWENIVEEINVVDSILSKDPCGAYPLMDMESKNYYRQVIVRIAETSSIHEAEVARTAVKLALQAMPTEKTKHIISSRAETHVGYYLIDDGRELLLSKIDYDPTTKERFYTFVTEHAKGLYFGTAFALDILLGAVFVYALFVSGASVALILTLTLLALFLNLEITLSLLNVLTARFLPVRKLPSFDLSNRITDKQRTFVVIPTMFRSVESIRETVRKLEVRYLGNRENNLYFALLFGFKDADQETLPEDQALVQTAQDAINALNEKYGGGQKKFFMLYRKRLWNASEGKFMEWERKRGKLREFNMLLRNAKDTTFTNEHELHGIPHIQYVITLDEDTELPRDSARKLVGCIDHPLNAPHYDEKTNIVLRGYGIIQPRAGVRLATAAKSLYSRLYSAGSGIDSYSSAISDVYQDLFGNALFFGKGIYDIDAVERTMAGQIPNNMVLSHDLLEGIYARTGYASQVILFDGFPNYYHEFAVRLHRWIRGDWQIIGWLRRVKNPSSSTHPREFSFVDRFKIFDNLRRSLVPVVVVGMLGLVLYEKKSALVVTGFVIAALSAPYLFAFLNDLFSIKHIPLRIRIYDVGRQFSIALAHICLRLLFVLHHATISISAIGVTLTRLFITKRKLLEWQISTDVGRKFRGRIYEFYRTMMSTQLVPIAYLLFVITGGRYNVPLYFFAVAWFFSPIVAYLVSRPESSPRPLSKLKEKKLRSIAYRTSRYFLDLSRRENNWLIQDHYQEFPKVSQVDRLTTSPTNIGMLFSSLFSSYELGYVSLDQFIDRSRKAFGTLLKLDRYKGHLLNWYDIEKLEPLAPGYLSSVDSANFVMALIAFRQGLRGVARRKVVGPHSIQGIEDGLYSVLEEARVLRKNIKGRNEKVIVKELLQLTEKAYKIALSFKMPVTFSQYYTFFTKVHPLVVDIEKAVANLRAEQAVKGADQLFFFVEHLAQLIEGEIGFERYLLPHLHDYDHSIAVHVARDEKLALAYRQFISLIEEVPSLHFIAHELVDKVEKCNLRNLIVESHVLSQSKNQVLEWYETLYKDVKQSEKKAKEFLSDLALIEKNATRFIEEPDFGFLYNKERGLFHIGYNVTYERVDSACYNFLASESNSISFVAILKNQVPQKHWFYLGRKLVRSRGEIGLVSWGGSLFEYLTSLIFLKAHPESLLGTTARSAIAIHKRHGRHNKTPWGMGESAYYLFDAAKHYQYQVFGSSALGLKRGLSDYLVIAPYVSALSLSYDPHDATANIERIENLGGVGMFGFYDALDYMDESRVRSIKPLPTRVYYAHHQGFTLLGIHNFLDKDRIRNLFHSDPAVASLEILLEEKMPATPAATTLSISTRLPFTTVSGISDDGTESKQYVPVKSPYPYLALIGNGSYGTTISNSGAGRSKYKKVSITRFKDDPVLEESGAFIYIRNEKTKALWSPTIRPLGGDIKKHKILFYENKAEFYAQHASVSSKLEISVDKKLPVEIRTLTLTNTGTSAEKLSIASYGELSLALETQEYHHPQYQKLLIKSTFNQELGALIYSRPHPSDRTRKLYFAHMVAKEGFSKEKLSACADREFFIGKSHTFKDPIYFDRQSDEPIREYTLDPIYSLSKSIELKSGESTKVTFVNAASEDYEELLETLRKFRRASAGQAVLSRALKDSAEITRELGITQSLAVVFQDLAGKTFGGKKFEFEDAPKSHLPYIHSLWKLGVSGDYPVVVVKIKDIEDIQTIKQALLCHSYWKHKGLEIDLVILNQEPSSYIKVLDDEIDFLLRQSKGIKSDVAGSAVHHVKSDLTEEMDKKVLLHVARVVLDSKDGTFKQQIKAFARQIKVPKYPEKHVPTTRAVYHALKQNRVLPDNLLFKNTWGGFDPKTSEYVMAIDSHHVPLSPWSNIITSPEFGTIVTESGAMFSWSKDSYDNRITSWNNDPLVYKSSEIIYLRDEETGELWNPTPMPIRTKIPFTVRHGKGYSIFEHTRGTLASSLEISASLSHPAKIVKLKITNNGAKPRTISQTVYLEPSLNVFRDHTRDFIVYERSEKTGALLMKQSYRNQLPNRTAFADLLSGEFTITTDKTEFFGRLGTYESPAALKREGLSNHVTLATSNCAVLQSRVVIEPGETREIVFVLGDADSRASADHIVTKLREEHVRKEAKLELSAYWKELGGVVEIQTPDATLDALFNHQLLYQATSSRLWGKTGYYQPSGAFGFRDQLQDISAFVWTKPHEVREFLLKVAAHQFKEGDGLNWWHEHNSFGARSVLSDHQLWFVQVLLEYIHVTGDDSILDVEVPFLEGPILNFAYQREWAGTPKVSEEKGSIYEHAVRALNKSAITGEHGLPLIGQSDWNDGLSRAGVLGRGESIWVGWFLTSLMNRFSSLAQNRGDYEKAGYFADYALNIAKALEKHAWDGKWYRRVFLDSGTILGSRKTSEFKIDSIAQSWAVLSGVAPIERAFKAMESTFTELYDGSNMKLLAPALRNSLFDPGYIRDYPPGVRENGSQYNHAALWAAQAFFRIGESDKGKQVLDLVNPFLRSNSPEKATLYRVEPYVVASDVYADPSYKGRGGWTWYTGSAGVMYKTILDHLLGFNLSGDTLSFNPSLPSAWKGCTITYRVGHAVYTITYEKPEGVLGEVVEVYQDNQPVFDKRIKVSKEKITSSIRVVLGERK